MTGLTFTIANMTRVMNDIGQTLEVEILLCMGQSHPPWGEP